MINHNNPEKDAPSLNGDEKKYEDFYRDLRKLIDSYIARHTNSGIAEILLYVPDFFYLLIKLSTDPRVPRGNKAQIIAAIAYFISPLDVIPDVIFGLGWLDDLYLAMIVTDNLLNAVELDVVKQYWPGDGDIVSLIKTTLDQLNDKLGMGAIKRILEKLRHTDDVVLPDDEGFEDFGDDK
jgi:uncharacterized membrane protein YkvA (DUF1232 family)